MAQLGFFDTDKRLAAPSARGDARSTMGELSRRYRGGGADAE